MSSPSPPPPLRPSHITHLPPQTPPCPQTLALPLTPSSEISSLLLDLSSRLEVPRNDLYLTHESKLLPHSGRLLDAILELKGVTLLERSPLLDSDSRSPSAYPLSPLRRSSPPKSRSLALTRPSDGSTYVVRCHRRSRGGCFIISFTIFCILCLASVMSFFTCGLSLCVFPFLLPLLFVLPFCFL